MLGYSVGCIGVVGVREKVCMIVRLFYIMNFFMRVVVFLLLLSFLRKFLYYDNCDYFLKYFSVTIDIFVA